MRNFRTFDLAVEFYRACKTLPVRGDAKDQLTRAARSIVLNLAEGRGKRTLKDQIKFFHTAFGSLRECQAVLLLEALNDSSAYQVLDRTAASLFKLIQNAR